MKSSFSRRNLLNLAARGLTSLGMASTALGLSGCQRETGQAQTKGEDIKPVAQATTKMARLPKAKGPRVIIVGGGIAGLSLAKYIKKANTQFDVVLLDRRNSFNGFTGSNLWCVSGLPMEKLAAYSHLEAAAAHDYWFLHATCIGLEKDKRQLITDQGVVQYDYLVFAPGIDYDYGKIGVTDLEQEFVCRHQYPGGFVHPMEYVNLRHKIQQFKKGVFIQTVPTGNYRCSQAPYERACLMASYFKEHKIKAKIIILDGNPDVTITKDGFHAAFSELYKDFIEYVPSSKITGIDLEKKEIETEFDNYAFDDASIYPNIRGSQLLEDLGLVDENSLQKEANIHPAKYHIPDDKRIYVIGDARPTPLSKSANVAYTEAKYVANLIAANESGKEIAWESPNILCYAMITHNPVLGISLDTLYQYNEKEKQFSFGRVLTNEKRSVENAEKGFKWADDLFQDIFV